jgi:hypothetical protein
MVALIEERLLTDARPEFAASAMRLSLRSRTALRLEILAFDTSSKFFTDHAPGVSA